MKAALTAYAVMFLAVYLVMSHVTGDMMQGLAFEITFAIGVAFKMVMDAFDEE